MAAWLWVRPVNHFFKKGDVQRRVLRGFRCESPYRRQRPRCVILLNLESTVQPKCFLHGARQQLLTEGTTIIAVFRVRSRRLCLGSAVVPASLWVNVSGSSKSCRAMRSISSFILPSCCSISCRCDSAFCRSCSRRIVARRPGLAGAGRSFACRSLVLGLGHELLAFEQFVQVVLHGSQLRLQGFALLGNVRTMAAFWASQRRRKRSRRRSA